MINIHTCFKSVKLKQMVLKYCETWHLTLILYDLIINVSNCNPCKEA